MLDFDIIIACLMTLLQNNFLFVLQKYQVVSTNIKGGFMEDIFVSTNFP